MGKRRGITLGSFRAATWGASLELFVVEPVRLRRAGVARLSNVEAASSKWK
jgi:hypothetical protein